MTTITTLLDCFCDSFCSNISPKQIMEAMIETARKAGVDEATISRMGREGWHIACDLLRETQSRYLISFKIVIEFRADGWCEVTLANQRHYSREDYHWLHAKRLDPNEVWHGPGFYWVKDGQRLGSYLPIKRSIIEHLDWYRQAHDLPSSWPDQS